MIEPRVKPNPPDLTATNRWIALKSSSAFRLLRPNFIYILRLNLLYRFFHYCHELQQVLRARNSAPARLLHERVLWSNIRPACWHKGGVPTVGQVIHSPLSPPPQTIDQFKLATPPRMERVSHTERLFYAVCIGCSPYPTPRQRWKEASSYANTQLHPLHHRSIPAKVKLGKTKVHENNSA